MASLTNIFVQLSIHISTLVSVKMCLKIYMFHDMSQTLFTVALTACPQSLPDSLPGRCDTISQT